jgi:hypothetical protein
MVKERVLAIFRGVKNFPDPVSLLEIPGLTGNESIADILSEIGPICDERFVSLSLHSAERAKETI